MTFGNKFNSRVLIGILINEIYTCLLILGLFSPATAYASAVIDLTSWDIDQNAGIEIKGNWDMYWGVVASPQDFAENSVSVKPIAFPVPGVWSKHRDDIPDFKPNHYATYRVQFILSDQLVEAQKTLRFETHALPGPYKLWINGRLAIKAGRIGLEEADEVPHYGFEYYDFIPENTKIDLVLATSAFHFRTGGVWWPFTLTDRTYAELEKRINFGVECFILSTLFIMSFYHFGIYIMRRHNIEALIFACLGICVGLRTLGTGLGNSDLSRLLGLNFHTVRFFEYGFLYLGVPLIYSFISKLYPQESPRFLNKINVLVGGVFFLSTLVFPVKIYTDFIEYFQVFCVYIIILSTLSLLLCLKRRRRGSILFAVGSLVLFICGVNDILVAHQNSPIQFNILPLGLYVLILFQSLALARIFTENYTIIEKTRENIRVLNDDLHEQNKNLNHSFRQLAKIVYPHQVVQIKSGFDLESTMPTGPGEAAVISFDIINSSKIQHVKAKDFLRFVFQRCNSIMTEGYEERELKAPAYRIKEMGDGFLCSIGYPFKSPRDSIVNGALELAYKFIEVVHDEAERLDYSKHINCGIGIAVDNISGSYPESGAKEYNLYGRAIILATRYEAMRKQILKDNASSSIIIVQERFFESLNRKSRSEFTSYDLKKHGIIVRDDPAANLLYYKIIQTKSAVNTYVKKAINLV